MVWFLARRKKSFWEACLFDARYGKLRRVDHGWRSIQCKGRPNGKRDDRFLSCRPRQLSSERTPERKPQIKEFHMIRTILSIAVLTSFAGAAALKADPSPAPNSSSSKNKNQTKTAPKIAPVVPLKQGWSLVNGVWTHSDGYQFVKGQVVRVGTQTHKKPPKPPTKAEMDAATKKPPKTSTNPAAAKTTERERNLRQIPAPQTGTHL